jgi:hypothetical protein
MTRAKVRTSPPALSAPRGTVLSAVAGDLVPARIRTEAMTVTLARAYHVHECCGEPSRWWLCLSCAQYLANRFQLDAHTETGTHVVARICPEHGAETLEDA